MAALVTGCYVTSVSLFSVNPKTGVLGYVAYTQPKDKWTVIRTLLVGFAPFFACGCILLLLLFIQNPHDMLDVGVVDADSYPEMAAFGLTVTSELFDHFLSLDLSNPLIWVVLYLMFCFALGSAPSREDFGGFFRSLIMYPFSTLFLGIVFYLTLFVSETSWTVYGFVLSDSVALFYHALVLILLVSVVLLLFCVPLVLVGDKFVELKLRERFFVFLGSLIVFLVSDGFFGFSTRKSFLFFSVALVGLTALFKHPTFFIRK